MIINTTPKFRNNLFRISKTVYRLAKVNWQKKRVIPILILIINVFIVSAIVISRLKNSNIGNGNIQISGFANDKILAENGASARDNNTCKNLGINSAVQFSKRRDPAGRNGTGWYLAIAEFPSDLTRGGVCRNGVNTIVRPWCSSAGCTNFTISGSQAIINKLASFASASCTVYVTGPNEPITEMHGDVNSTVSAMQNLVNAVKNSGSSYIKVLTPAFNATAGGEFIKNVSGLLPWDGIDGIAMNTYSLEKSASTYMRETLNILNHDSLPVFITETGPYEATKGVPRTQAIDNLKGEVSQLLKTAKAVLFFNGSGDNSDTNFKYGCIQSSELSKISVNSCNSDSNSYCDNNSNIDNRAQPSRNGCFEFQEEFAAKSCAAKQTYNNGGNNNSLDTVNAGVEMRRITKGDIKNGSYMPGDEHFYSGLKDGEERWIYKYAITENIEYVPLLQFLAGVKGTPQHSFVTGPQINTYNNFKKETHRFGDQFPGIATFKKENNKQFQLQVPSLGTASASGQYDKNNLYETYRPHCGLSWRYDHKEENLPRNKNLLKIFDKLIANFKNNKLVKFNKSTKSIYQSFLNKFINLINGILVRNDSSAIDPNLCKYESGGIPIKAYDRSDGYELDIKNYETIIDSNISRGWELPSMKPFTPDDMCELMFSGRIDGGTCNIGGLSLPITGLTDDPFLRDFAESNNVKDALFGDRQVRPRVIFEYFRNLHIHADSIGGSPFYRIENSKTTVLELEGLLKYLEKAYRLEAILAPPSYKICHYDNIGIEVPSTKRLYDYYLTSNDSNTKSSTQVNTKERKGSTIAQKRNQLFYATDITSENLLTANNTATPKTFLMTQDEKDGLSNGDPSGTITKPKLAINNGTGAGNSMVSVTHTFPWIGQIPLMMERFSVWSVDNQHGFTDPNMVKRLSDLKGDPNDISSELGKAIELFSKNMDELALTNKEFLDVYLFPCGFFENTTSTAVKAIKNVLTDKFNYNETDFDRIANGDCLCQNTDSDPLRKYLIKEGMLKHEAMFETTTENQCVAPTKNTNGKINRIPGGKVDITMFNSPVDEIRITQGFGPSTHKYGSQGYFHNGIDFGASNAQGTPIKAASNGLVIWAGSVSKIEVAGNCPKNNSGKCYGSGDGYTSNLSNFWQYGNEVIIEHPNGYRTRYAHLNSISVSVNQEVQQGETIGIMGNTGNSSGTHLHFELQKPSCYTWSDTNCFEDPSPILTNKAPKIYIDNLSKTKAPICSNKIDTNYNTDNTGNEKNHICLVKKVANIVNSYNNKPRVPWYVILATWDSETYRRCTPLYSTFFTTLDAQTIHKPIGYADLNGKNKYPVFDYKDTCNGNPNNLALTDIQTQDKDGKGIGGYIKGTFLSLTEGWYWYKPARYGDNTKDVLARCVQQLGINGSIGQEDRNELGGAFWNSNKINDSEKQRLKSTYSRKRVGDSLCAMAIQLSENASNHKEYIKPEDWTDNDITNASYGYYGACDTGLGFDYCKNMIARSKLFKDLYSDMTCE